ncbi:MAG: CapA family protein [bacterium]|jgi:poly-gamma-glutamate capsule biosynthesis protein CapA/YwtB (metallophosphatase superfamily)
MMEFVLTLVLAAGLIWAVRERMELESGDDAPRSDAAAQSYNRNVSVKSPGSVEIAPARERSDFASRAPANTVPSIAEPAVVGEANEPAESVLNSAKPGDPRSSSSYSELQSKPFYEFSRFFRKRKPQPAIIKIGLAGDIDIPQVLKDRVAKSPDMDILKGVAEVRDRLDLLAGNLEGQLTRAGTPTAGKTPEDIEDKKEFLLKDDPKWAARLRKAGFRLLTTANNHAMDFGWKGLEESLAALNNAGISPVGAGKDDKTARAPRFIEVKGKKIGFLAYTATIPPGYAAGANRPGVAAGRGNGTASLGSTWRNKLAAEVKAARARCDYLIVGFHWGTEKSDKPSELQREIAEVLTAAGADLIFGHGPHVLQPVELINGKPVAFSLGNFIWHGGRETALLEVELESTPDGNLNTKAARLHGCKLEKGAPVLTGSVEEVFPASQPDVVTATARTNP